MDRDRLLSPAEWLAERWHRREQWFELTNTRRYTPVVPPAGPAAATFAGWSPLLTGQAVPLVGEYAPSEGPWYGGDCAHGESCDCGGPGGSLEVVDPYGT